MREKKIVEGKGREWKEDEVEVEVEREGKGREKKEEEVYVVDVFRPETLGPKTKDACQWSLSGKLEWGGIRQARWLVEGVGQVGKVGLGGFEASK